jgi:hypothetical protein
MSTPNSSEDYDLSQRYCCSRTEYAREVGDVRQNSVAKVFKELFPFADVKCGHVNANGTDITITYNGEIFRIEVINEDVSSYIDNKRAVSISTNLANSTQSLFICNHGNFGSSEAENIVYGIPTLRIGWQELPPKHHNFYKKKDDIYERRVSSKRSYRKLKQQILNFLILIKFKLLMYIKYSRTAISNKITTVFARIKPRINIINKISVKLALPSFKIRLKNCLLELKSAVKARFSNSNILDSVVVGSNKAQANTEISKCRATPHK